jgi:hypothetical protein
LAWEALGSYRAYCSPDCQTGTGSWQISLEERYNFLKVPLMYQHRFGGSRNSKVQAQKDAFVEAGLYGRVLLNSQTKVHTTRILPEGKQEVSSIILDGQPPRREVLAMGGSLGVGYHLHLSGFSLFARLALQFEMLRKYKTNAQRQEDHEHLLWEYHAADQYLRLNSLQLVVGAYLQQRYRVKNFKQL